MGLRPVELCVGDRFPKPDMNVGILMPGGFIGQKEHLQIPFDVEAFAKIGHPIEAVGVAATDEYGNHIALVLNCFGDEVLFPLQIKNPVPNLS